MKFSYGLRNQPGIKGDFDLQRYCFSRVGINIISLEHTFTSQLKFCFLLVSEMCLCFPILLYAIENAQDLYKATDSLSPFWQMIICSSKVIYFALNGKKIVTELQLLWKWNSEAREGEEQAILAKEIRNDIIFGKFFHLAVTVTSLTALMQPFLVAGFFAWQGESFWENLKSPLLAAYGIDKKSYLGYSLVYIWNASGIYFIAYGSLAIDCLFSWFMYNIVAHFRILKYRLRQAGAENDGNGCHQTICDCIAYHCRTLKMTKDVNTAFGAIVFIKFAISCIGICCLAFQLSRDTKLLDQVYHGLFLLSASIQITLYCYGGQRIQDESCSIAIEIYQSFQWESLSLNHKKMLILFMRKSQEPCKISGLFFTANFSLLLWVCRTAASLITMLWTMDGEIK